MRTSYLGVGVLLAGLVAMSVGGAVHVDAQRCQTVAGLSVAAIDGEAPGNVTRVAYGELSTDQQQVFDEARTAGNVLAQRGVFTGPRVVAHEGTDYLLRVTQEPDCGDPFGNGAIGPAAGGLALVALGAGIAKYGN
jgi:hypothetical protein